MKRLLFIGFYLNLCICLVAQTTKTYTIAFDRDNFYTKETSKGFFIDSYELDLYYELDLMKPCIPYITVNILLPSGHKVIDFSYTYNNSSTTRNITLCNNPKIITSNTQNDSVSNNTTYPIKNYPYSVSFLGQKTSYGFNYASFKVTPISYNAISKEVNWASNVNITIKSERISSRKIINNVPNEKIIDMFKKTLINPEDLTIYYSTPSVKNNVSRNVSDSIKYLIITADSLKEAFRPLAEWKTAKGVKAKIITIEEIYEQYSEATNQLKIKSCLRDYYNSGLVYALLGGDDIIVPVQGCFSEVVYKIDEHYSETICSDNSIPTDLFYACFNGSLDWNKDGDNKIGEIKDDSIDYTANIYLSRIPVRTSKDVNAFTLKTINYERNPPTDNWHNSFLSMGVRTNDSIYNGRGNAEIISEYFHNYYLKRFWPEVNKTKFYDTGTDFEGNENYDVNPENIKEQIENGYHYIQMHSHGYYFCWSVENSGHYYAADTKMLNNSKATIITTTACETNAFDSDNAGIGSDPCLSEAFLRNPNSGIVAYLGSSREGIGYKDTITIGPSMRINMNFFKGIYEEGHTRIGEAVAYAKNKTVSINNNNPVFIWLLYCVNLIGDPELPIYTQVPQQIIGVNYSTNNDSLFVHTNTEKCTFTLSSKNDGGASFYKTVKNINSYTFSDIPSLENCQLCISKDNHIPILISDLSKIYVQNKTYSGTNVITGTDIYIGKDVTNATEEGSVIIESGSTTFDATNSVTIKNGFECKKGATLEIK